MKSNIDNMLAYYWDNCKGNFAHIKENWEIKPDSRRARQLYDAFLGSLELRGKTVIDYGCGGGWFGKLLFDEYKIGKYVGLDVAHRSLKRSHENLENYRENVKLKFANEDFGCFNADVFISMAVIQHFPTVKYLDEFLVRLNTSGIQTIILHVRYGEKTEYCNPYVNNRDVKDAGVTNERHIGRILTNYGHVYNYDAGASKAVYLKYELQ
ncbi:MAG TPA: class I SAM-dependent methyltransferase [Anaerolineae bacterium]|nr:class I SAM-dependent methyltransferase [Anaerolineae bacterium]